MNDERLKAFRFTVCNPCREAAANSAAGAAAAATFSVIEGHGSSSSSVGGGSSRPYKRMGSEKYKLKWSKYESNILSAFHGLLESENLSDVTLFCEGENAFIAQYHIQNCPKSNY